MGCGYSEINKISFRCIYDIKNNNNETQIINNKYEEYINEDIESKIKILNDNKKENLIFKKKFDKIGLNTIDFIIEGNLNNMSYIFNNCSSLKQIQFLSFDTESVTNMKQMFQECIELEYIDLNKFNTSNVTNMAGMFNKCIKIKGNKRN